MKRKWLLAESEELLRRFISRSADQAEDSFEFVPELPPDAAAEESVQAECRTLVKRVRESDVPIIQRRVRARFAALMEQVPPSYGAL